MKRRDLLLGAAAVGPGGPLLAKAAISPLHAQPAAPKGAKIAKATIFPAIGFSRVGNAEEWFLAPEVPGLLDEPEGGFKDKQGRIKKRVQRFRLFGYDDQGRVVRELDGADGQAPADLKRWMGPKGLPGVPDQLYVEVQRGSMGIAAPTRPR